MPKVEPRKTTATELEALAALAKAFARVFRRRPTRRELLVFWVQSAHETGGWASMPNWNPAGIKAGRGYGGDWRTAMTWEGKGADAKRVPQEFRAYRDLESGMVDWLDIMRRGYEQACAAAGRGDVEGFVAGLLEGWGNGSDYFTGDPTKYVGASKKWLALLGHLPIAWADICAPDGAEGSEA